MIDTSIDLKEFDDAFASAPSSLGEVSDGTYIVHVDDVSLLRSKAGNPMLVWDFRILGPEFEGRMLKKRSAITEKTVSYVRKELEACGLTLRKMSELSGQLHRMMNVELEISKMTRNGDSNLYINRKAPAGGSANELTDDDLPF